MIYGHQHPGSSVSGERFASSASAIPHHTLKEHCDLCDVMHHNAMLASYQIYLKPVVVGTQIYKGTDYSFTSIQLILAGGRAPPSSNS